MSSQPEDRISKDTRRWKDWKEFVDFLLRIVLLVVLILTGLGIRLAAMAMRDWGIKEQNRIQDDRQFIRDEVTEIVGGISRIENKVDESLTPVAPAIEKVGVATEKAGIAVAKAGNSSALLGEAAKEISNQGGKFFRDTSYSLNDPVNGVLPLTSTVLKNLATVAASFNISVNELTNALKTIPDATNQIKKLFSDEMIANVTAIIDELKKTSGNITSISDSAKAMFINFKLASDQAPKIAELWMKIMKTGHILQIPLAIAQFLGLLAPILKPIFGIN
jgi:hypothetical protein